MFNLSGTHLLIVLVIALLLFGNRLPEIARSLGRSLNEFKRGMRDVTSDVNADEPPVRPDSPQLRPPSESVARGEAGRVEEPVGKAPRDKEA